jgi:hypothetical protein
MNKDEKRRDMTGILSAIKAAEADARAPDVGFSSEIMIASDVARQEISSEASKQTRLGSALKAWETPAGRALSPVNITARHDSR